MLLHAMGFIVESKMIQVNGLALNMRLE